MDSIYYCYFLSPIGKLLLLEKRQHLIGLDMENEQCIPPANWIFAENRPLFTQVSHSLQRYFSGHKENFSEIPIAPQGTAFQMKVWQLLRQIPYGSASSYGQLAACIGKPQAARAIGGAVGINPISIIIPCHRILGSQQQLTGFGGGLAAKRYLLQLENIAYKDHGIENVKGKQARKYRL